MAKSPPPPRGVGRPLSKGLFQTLPPSLEGSNVRQSERGLGPGGARNRGPGVPQHTLPQNDALCILGYVSWGKEFSDHFLSGPLGSPISEPMTLFKKGF